MDINAIKDALIRIAETSSKQRVTSATHTGEIQENDPKNTPSGVTTQAFPYHDLSGFVSFVRSQEQDNGLRPFHTHSLSYQRAFDCTRIRRDFPILSQRVNGHPLAWFDNAATTQKPKVVIDGVSQFYRESNSNIHRGAHTLAARATDAFEGARKKIHTFLNAEKTEEIIFVRGTTEGINLVAQTLGQSFQEGDEIILSTLEHHANIVPWQLLAQKTGAKIKVIPIDHNGDIVLSAYMALLTHKTKLVAITHANNSLGTRLPIEEMIGAAKKMGAYVLIDGAQSVAHIPIDVQSLGCDFFVFSGHKIFGPTGIGALYIHNSLLERLPVWHGGGNMIADVTFEHTRYQKAPAKFEAGTPNIADAYGLGLALDYVTAIGLKTIAQYEDTLLAYATEALSRVSGLRLIGTAKHKVAVTSFVMDGMAVEEIGKRLNAHGIAVRSGHHCAQPSLRHFGVEATVRPSYSFYNTTEEIDRMISVLKGFKKSYA